MNKKTRWGDQYRGGVMLDINHNAWRIYNNCRPFGNTEYALNIEYASRVINGFVTDTVKQMARDLMLVVVEI